MSGDIDLFENYIEGSDQLILSGKHITCDKIIEEIIPFLFTHPHIKTVDLSHNEIGDDGCVALATIESIESLNLSHNNIGDQGAVTITQNQNIKQLDLGHNRLQELGHTAMNQRFLVFDKLYLDAIGLVLAQLTFKEAAKAAPIAKIFNRYLNQEHYWRHKFELYFPFYLNELQGKQDWKKNFKEYYKKLIINNNEININMDDRPIVDAIFENKMDYILQVDKGRLCKVFETLRNKGKFYFNPAHKEMNEYLYTVYQQQHEKFLSFDNQEGMIATWHLLRAAIYLHQPEQELIRIVEYIRSVFKGKLGHDDLLMAIQANNHVAIKFIINNFDSNLRKNLANGRNILHVAAEYNLPDVFVKMLLLGSDINKYNNKDIHPLAYFNADTIMKMIKEHAIDSYIVFKENPYHNVMDDLLKKAILEKHDELFYYLYNKYYKNGPYKIRENIISVLDNNEIALNLVIDKINLKFIDNRTALLFCARKSNHPDIIDKILQRLKAFPYDKKYSQGYEGACNTDNYRILKYILSNDSDAASSIGNIKQPLTRNILILNLNAIDPNNTTAMMALMQHFSKIKYDHESTKLIVNKLSTSPNWNWLKHESLSMLSHCITHNKRHFIDFVFTLGPGFLKNNRRSISKALRQGLSASRSTEMLKMLNYVIKSPHIVNILENHDRDKLINNMITRFIYKDLLTILKTLKSIYPPKKYKALLMQYTKHAIRTGNAETVAVMLSLDPPITPAMQRLAKNAQLDYEGHLNEDTFEITKLLNKKLLEYYIKDRESGPEYKSKITFFGIRPGYSKQEKLASAKQALKNVSDNHSVTDKSRVAKTGKLGRVIRRVKKYF